MAKKKKAAAEASTGGKGVSSSARPSAATTARARGAAVELSLASEERVRQLLTTLAVRVRGARPILVIFLPYVPARLRRTVGGSEPPRHP